MKNRLLSAVGFLSVLMAVHSVTAAAPTVIFHMVYNDDGTGGAAPGAFAIYATTSAGDNGGLLVYGVDLTGPVLDLGNSGQGVSFRKGTFPPNTRTAGFTGGYSIDVAKGAITGSQDLVKTTPEPNPTWGDMIPVFGLGQETGNLMALQPPTHPQFTDINGNGTAYGTRSGYGISGDVGATGPWSHGYFLGMGLAAGRVQDVQFEKTSLDLVSGVWMSRGPAGPNDPLIQIVKVVPLVSYEFAAVPEPATIGLLGLGALGILVCRRRTA